MLLEALIDAAGDSLKLLPFLYATYLFMEWLEHGAAERFERSIVAAGKAGPLVGALLGVVPQCGFSGAAATLYAGRVITFGTLLAVVLSTSDEMLPIMISEAASPLLIGKVLVIKVVCGIVLGFAFDAALHRRGRGHVGLGSTYLHAGHEGHDIGRLCEAEGCDCAHEDCDHCQARHRSGHGHGHGSGHGHGAFSWGHIALAALRHSLQIFAFVLIICFLLNLVVGAGLEQTLAVVQGSPVVATLLCAVLGLVPNCAVSVGFTQLYLEGILGGGAMIAGLLSNGGIGLLVLLRTNNDARENLRICGVLVIIGVAVGLVVGACGIL